jgi:hypothetical protein
MAPGPSVRNEWTAWAQERRGAGSEPFLGSFSPRPAVGPFAGLERRTAGRGEPRGHGRSGRVQCIQVVTILDAVLSLTRDPHSLAGEQREISRDPVLFTRDPRLLARDLPRISREQTEISREQVEISREQVEISREQNEISRDQSLLARDLVLLAREQLLLTREQKWISRDADRVPDAVQLASPRPALAVVRSTIRRRRCTGGSGRSDEGTQSH